MKLTPESKNRKGPEVTLRVGLNKGLPELPNGADLTMQQSRGLCGGWYLEDHRTEKKHKTCNWNDLEIWKNTQNAKIAEKFWKEKVVKQDGTRNEEEPVQETFEIQTSIND